MTKKEAKTQRHKAKRQKHRGTRPKGNSRKSVTWSAVPDAPKLVCVRCDGERRRGPKEQMTYAGLRYKQ